MLPVNVLSFLRVSRVSAALRSQLQNWQHLGNVRGKHDDVCAFCVARGVLTTHSSEEVNVRNVAVRVDLALFFELFFILFSLASVRFQCADDARSPIGETDDEDFGEFTWKT